MKEPPLAVVYNSLRLLLTGQPRLIREHVGKAITRPDGRSFKIFRQVVMKPQAGRPAQSGAVFHVWFYARTRPVLTIAMSWLTLLFFIGMRGFRSKIWLYDEASGEFGGIYEWDTLEQAEAYGRSFAMKLSALRSVPGQFRKETFAADDPGAGLHRAVRPAEVAAARAAQAVR